MKKIESKEDLINYFNKGSKNEKNLGIGVEHEKFLFHKNNKRVDFKIILDIFNLLKGFDWKPIKENGYTVGLRKGDKRITLEPGNQIELSGEKLDNVHLSCKESYKYLNELKIACNKLNLKMMSVSFDPFTKLKNVPKTPKDRYKIMTKEMPKKGKLSLHMMYQTCGTQINLDYKSEEDFKKKFKLSSFLVPISTAIFANSPIAENRPSGYLSYRSIVWQNTSRAGLPKIFLQNMDFEKYVDMAINVPLLFVIKNYKHLKTQGKTFKDFMEGNVPVLGKTLPSIDDFKNHLATIFTEVRLKQYIEIRSLDTCEWDCHCGGPAFYVGLLYGNLDLAYEIVNKWSSKDVMNAYIDAPKKGLNTIIDGKTVLEWGRILLNISKKGLENRSFKNENGKDESIFLRSVENIIFNEKTKANITLEKFKHDKNLSFLYEKT